MNRIKKKKGMKKRNVVILGFAVATATIAAILVTKAIKHSNRLNHIADEGYETAPDILYPERKTYRRKLHYGPVVPQEDILDTLN